MSSPNKSRAQREARERHQADPSRTYQQHLAQVRAERAARAGRRSDGTPVAAPASPEAPTAPPTVAPGDSVTPSGPPSTWGTCPSCAQPRPLRVSDTFDESFLPGSVCPGCGHVETEIEYEADDDGWLVTMDDTGTVRYVDRWGNTEYIGALDDEDWNRWAAPLDVDHGLVAAAVRLAQHAPDTDPADLWGEAPFRTVAAGLGWDHDVDDEGGHVTHLLVTDPTAAGDSAVVEYRVEAVHWDDPGSGLLVVEYAPHRTSDHEVIDEAVVARTAPLNQAQVHDLLYAGPDRLVQYADDVVGRVDPTRLECARCGADVHVDVDDGAVVDRDGVFVCTGYTGHDEHDSGSGPFAPHHVLADAVRDRVDEEQAVHVDSAADACPYCRALRAARTTVIEWADDAGRFLLHGGGVGNPGCDECGQADAVARVDGVYLCESAARDRGVLGLRPR